MKRNSLLVLCFFPAFDPPASGGEMRLLKLYKAVSLFADVTLLTSTDFGARQETIHHTSGFREIRFPKDEHWSKAYATLNSIGLEGDLSGLAMALAVSDPNCSYVQAALSLAPEADAIIHEFPYSEPIFSDRSYTSKEFYNSHNFETSLLGAVVRGPGFEVALLKLMRMERNLATRAVCVLGTSEADIDKFRLFHGVERNRLLLCPNGYDKEELCAVVDQRLSKSNTDDRRPILLFLGSAHPPNVEAAQALISMAPRLSNCDIVLAGSLSNMLPCDGLPSNVILYGVVDQNTKIKLLTEADVFVNPVVFGSGTSLKALEALGAGIPLVTTAEGVRGLTISSGRHAIVVERAFFPEAVLALLKEPNRARAIAAAAKALVDKLYDWSSIAEVLRLMLDRNNTKKFSKQNKNCREIIVAFNDYEVKDARSGGHSRIINVLSRLNTEVVLITFGDRFDVFRICSGIMGILVPKSAEHTSYEAAMNDGQSLSINDIVASLFVSTNRVMRELAADITRRAEAIIFEHSYMSPILDVIDEARPNVPIIYSAHNVEKHHRSKMLEAHSNGEIISLFVKEIEEQLTLRANLVVCCTETDASHFASAGVKTVLLPNGCSINNSVSCIKSADRKTLKIGFLGSAHGPNVEAALFIISDLAPSLPNIQFEFVGSVCNAINVDVPLNVILHGVVDDSVKSIILSDWTLAVNPVTSGGGSSLKLPDFMAHGLPTVNTIVGARGFRVQEFGAGVVTDRDNFGRVIQSLVSDDSLIQRMSSNARHYAETILKWDSVVRPYSAEVGDLIKNARSASHTISASQSVLVVTYRYTEPALGGAEEYLVEVLKRLRHRFARIDLAAIDVEKISNTYHFGCQLTLGYGGASRICEIFDRALFFKPVIESHNVLIERCRRLERVWMTSEFHFIVPFIGDLAKRDQIHLLSGFYGAERHGDLTRRWTACDFAILLPKHARTLRLSGFCNGSKSLIITVSQLTHDSIVEDIAEYQVLLSTHFVVNFSLPENANNCPIIVRAQIEEHVSEGDHRPLGMLLDSISSLVSRVAKVSEVNGIDLMDEVSADLAHDKETELRSDHFVKWIEGLKNLARQNAPEVEKDFAAVRGPHSPVLQSWLAEHAASYDVVLIQGIPFDVIPRSVETLRKTPKSPRLVTLPHFHGDDRFYYWKRYIDAFHSADATMLFSSSIAESLNIPGKLAVVPGGGVREIELGNVDATRAFRAIYQSSTPYFLVLGRKTGSKGYQAIIAAHQELRSRGLSVGLLIIGPDDDGLEVSGVGVTYLGRQPRAVVQGALRECVSLVSMSVSESFGIVICEAWLYNRPVIANRACYAFRDLVIHGKTGFLVGSQADLTSAMEAMLLAPGHATAMGRDGRNVLFEKYTWDKVAEQVYDVLVGP